VGLAEADDDDDEEDESSSFKAEWLDRRRQ
jgi:hypothetical protein